MKFPNDFIWGAACSSYQSEGAWNIDGKGPSIWDDFSHDSGKGHVLGDETGDVSCDSYHRYKEDIALMKKCGLKVFRLSISWPRVIPNGVGDVNQAGLDYYDNYVNELIANDIEPWITLYHWDLPSALQEKGGWLNRDTVDAFGAYAKLIGKHFDGRVTHYMPLNEPQCVVQCGHNGLDHAPGIPLNDINMLKTYHHLALAQGVAAAALRETSSQSIMVGTAMCGRICYPSEQGQAAEDAAYDAMFKLTDDNWVFTYNIIADAMLLKKYPDDAPAFIKEFEKTIPQSDWDLMADFDFFGMNIYNGNAVNISGTPVNPPQGAPMTAIRWYMTQEAMRYGLEFIYKRYGLPIVITENGQSCNDRIFLDDQVHDPDRIDFLNRYLLEMATAMENGVPVKGYLHWSFLDNFEWAAGYRERFGLVYIDYATQQRILKDSAYWYTKVIQTNGEHLFNYAK